MYVSPGQSSETPPLPAVLLGIGVPTPEKTEETRQFADNLGIGHISFADVRNELMRSSANRITSRAIWDALHCQVDDILRGESSVLINAAYLDRWRRTQETEIYHWLGAQTLAVVFNYPRSERLVVAPDEGFTHIISVDPTKPAAHGRAA